MDDLLLYARIAIAVVYGTIFLLLAGIVYAAFLLLFAPPALLSDLIARAAPVLAVVLVIYCGIPVILSHLRII